MDSDLEAIRAKRMAELQSGGGGGGGGSSSLPKGLSGAGGGGGGGDAEAEQKFQQEEEQRRTVMSQILSPEARERLSRIALVRPERAKGIEQLLMRMAQGGQLRGKVSEDQLIGVLDQVEAGEKRGGAGGPEKHSGKIVFSRKKAYGSDSDDY